MAEVSGWGPPADRAYTDEAPRAIATGVAAGGTPSAPGQTSTNPFATNFSGVQPGTGKGTGYAAVNVNQGQVENPWGAMLAKDTATQIADTKQAQQNISTLDSMKSDYPAMPNAYGLGAPVANQPTDNSSASAYAQKPITSPEGSGASGGINPWSLQGEATARNSW